MPKGIYKRTKEAIKNMRKSHLGLKYPNRKRIVLTKEHKENIGKKLRINGPLLETHKQNISEAKKGQIAWNKGLRLPQISGENHWNWQGGVTLNPYSVDWTDILKESIRMRDGYVCQMEGCGIHQDELDRKLDVHHINYDKFNCNPDNLITLCGSCHAKTNSHREYWLDYFNTDE